MKKSVNGKSFDEIFEQKGERIQSFMLRNGHFYLSIGTLDEPKSIIEYDLYYNYNIHCSEILTIGGLLAQVRKTISIDGDFFKATTDQIALLNLYKSEA